MAKGREKFGPYLSRFDAFGIITEEYEEFKKAVFWESHERQVEEALHLAATAMRFVDEKGAIDAS